MYRDDVCAVCGESLPPDHFYCREHAAEVDERLHEIGELAEQLAAGLPRLAELLAHVAPETWDWLAEDIAGDPELEWPPVPLLRLAVHADEVDVDVDSEPGMVRIEVTTALATLLAGLRAGLDRSDVGAFAHACRSASGAGATH